MSRFLILSFIFILSCNKSSKNATDDILSVKEMQQILKDMAQAEEYVTQYVTKDNTKKHLPETLLLYNKIFTIHHTNSKQVLNSFDYYLSNPKQTRDILDSLQMQSRRVPMTSRPTIGPEIKPQ